MAVTRLQRTPTPLAAPVAAPAAPPQVLTPLLRPYRADMLAAAPVRPAGAIPAVAPAITARQNALQVAIHGGLRISEGNRTSLYVDGDRAYPALVDLIRGAKHTLYLETMIWHNDEAGRQIAAEVVAARKRGVDVKVLTDSVGEHFGDGRHHDPQLLEWMRSQGVDVHQYNPHYLGPHGVAITHHKLYIADNDRYLSGGMNIGNEYAHDWHDMLFQIEGPAAREAAGEFAVDWARASGEHLVIPPAPPVTPATNPAPGTAAVGIAVTDPDGQRFELRRATLGMIATARHSVRVQMPYNSDNELMDALKAAARRGVNVEYIMPTSNNDTLAFAYLNAAEAEDLQRAGVHVHFYNGNTINGRHVDRFSHLKMIMVDDTVAAVGSANADHRTYYNNNEINAYIADPQFISALHQDVWDKDWDESRAVTADELHHRPLLNRMAGAFYQAIDRIL